MRPFGSISVRSCALKSTMCGRLRVQVGRVVGFGRVREDVESLEMSAKAQIAYRWRDYSHCSSLSDIVTLISAKSTSRENLLCWVL